MKKVFFVTVFILAGACACFAQSNVNSQVIQNTFQDFGRAESSNLYGGSFLPQFNHKEDTKGTRYLFEQWAKGSITDTANNVISNANYLFNYDKIAGSLLVTSDKKTVFELNKETIKSFTLNSDTEQFVFDRIPFINNGNFVQQLVKGDKYYLYKSIRTKFIKSDYHTDGMVESGNPYDEYADQVEYYILASNGKDFKQLQLKKRDIKKAFVAESAKVNTYFSLHRSDMLNENFLNGLIIFLNQ